MNILVILVDQWRADHLGLVGRVPVATPHLDALASRGTAFLRAVTPVPICQPARAALLTGRYPHQINLHAMSGDLLPGIATVPQALQRAGYRTAHIGKLHVVHGTPPKRAEYPVGQRGQQRLGFDHFWECAGKELVAHHWCDWAQALAAAGAWEAYTAHLARAKTGGYLANTPLITRWRPCPWPLDPALQADEQIGAQAERWLANVPTDRPFAATVSFCGPHPPYDPPQSWVDAEPMTDEPILADLSLEEEAAIRAVRRCYRAMIRRIDAWVGRLLEVLIARGLDRDTMVVFTSDHGDQLGDRRLYNKGVPWAASTRIPLIMSLPGGVPGQRVDVPVELTDLSSTLLRVAGCDPGSALGGPFAFHDRLPGQDLLPVLRGAGTTDLRTTALSGGSGDWWMVESQGAKLIRTRDRSTRMIRESLYDLTIDPDETTDRIGDPALTSVAHDLRVALLARLEEFLPCQHGHAWR